MQDNDFPEIEDVADFVTELLIQVNPQIDRRASYHIVLEALMNFEPEMAPAVGQWVRATAFKATKDSH